ncbi:MAG: SRPBCC domain-containing protein, partial [Saprospiraceae bacterium]|nr:SRPBCC domain-containing protein [Saprospiraceae bacterium]
SIVWALLTNADDYPRWNSTVLSLEGEIAEGQKIRLRSSLDPERTFKLRVKEFEPEHKLVWGDGKGNRIYLIVSHPEGGITLSIVEKIGGLMFPLYAGLIPSFDQSFEQFAHDIKKEAELIAGIK